MLDFICDLPLLILSALLGGIFKEVYIKETMLDLEEDGRGGEFHDKNGGTLRLLPKDKE